LVAYNAGPGRLDRWIQDAGSYAAWRSEREAAGDSQVLDYARKVAAYRERFAERGLVAPPYNQPGDRAVRPPVLATTPVPYGPPALPSADADDQREPDGDS